MNLDEFELLSAELIDDRKAEMTLVSRVVGCHKNTPLEGTAAIMAVPLMYAHWEGFVKELLTLYLTYIESNELQPASLQPHVFAYSMKSKIKLLGDSGSVERCADFSSWVIETLTHPVRFEDKNVDTNSNLSYSNLLSLCETLYIDVSEIALSKRHINALVHRRNNIAHTGRPLKMDEEDAEKDKDLALRLISTFHSIVIKCARSRVFERRFPPHQAELQQTP